MDFTRFTSGRHFPMPKLKGRSALYQGPSPLLIFNPTALAGNHEFLLVANSANYGLAALGLPGRRAYSCLQAMLHARRVC